MIEKYKKHGKSAWDEAAKKKAKNLAEDKKRRERREKEERELKEASQIMEVELQLSPLNEYNIFLSNAKSTLLMQFDHKGDR